MSWHSFCFFEVCEETPAGRRIVSPRARQPDMKADPVAVD